MAFRDLLWLIESEDSNRVYQCFENEIKPLETDTEAEKNIKKTKRDTYLHNYVMNNLLVDSLVNRSSIEYAKPKILQKNLFKSFCLTTGWSLNYLVNTFISDQSDADGVPLKVDWANDTQRAVAASIQKLSFSQKTKLLEFLLGHVPERYRCIILNPEEELDIAPLIDYLKQSVSAGGKIRYNLRVETGRTSNEFYYSFMHARLEIHALPELVKRTGLSPHILLGIPDMPLLCDDLASENIMDAFTMLPDDLQYVLSEVL